MIKTKALIFRVNFLPYSLWSKLTQAIKLKDMEAATEAKSAVEDAQREMRRKMEESGEKYTPRFFQLVDGRWEPKLMSVASTGNQCSHINNHFAVYQKTLRQQQMKSRNGYGRVLPQRQLKQQYLPQFQRLDGIDSLRCRPFSQSAYPTQ